MQYRIALPPLSDLSKKAQFVEDQTTRHVPNLSNLLPMYGTFGKQIFALAGSAGNKLWSELAALRRSAQWPGGTQGGDGTHIPHAGAQCHGLDLG